MKRVRLFNIVCCLSMFILLAMVPVWIISELPERIDPIGFDIAGPFHVAGRAQVKLVDGWIAFSTRRHPFFDGSVGFNFSRLVLTTSPREVHREFPGFLFRQFIWPGVIPGGSDWTCAVTPIYPMLLCAILPVVWVIRRLRSRPVANGILCTTCSYNLTGNISGVCPECGATTVSEGDVSR